MSELRWQKSTYSPDASNCLEIAAVPVTATVHVRDSKHPVGPRLTVRSSTWAHFVSCLVQPRPQ
ncbi:DUF397 domain-containing protein [Streptomyces sp. 900105755]